MATCITNLKCLKQIDARDGHLYYKLEVSIDARDGHVYYKLEVAEAD